MKKILTLIFLFIVIEACSIGNKSNEIKFKEKDSKTLRESDINSKILHNYLVGQIALNDKDYELAKESFEEINSLSKKPVEKVNKELAVLYLRDKNLDKTEKLLKKQLEENYSNNLRLLYGGVLIAQDKLIAGFNEYQKLIVDDVAQAYLLKATLLYKHGEKAASINVLENYFASKKTNYLNIAQYIYGKLIEEDNEIKALSFYKKSYLNKKFRRGKFAFLRLAAELKKFDEIVEFCKEHEVQKDPLCDELSSFIKDNALNKENLSAYNLELAKLDNVSFKPENSHLNLALLFLENQNFFTAERELEIINAYSGKDTSAKFYLASLYAGQGNAKLATKLIKEIDEDNETFIKSRIFGSFLAKRNSDLSLSEYFLREAYEFNPSNQQVLSLLLSILEKQNKHKEMLKILKKALNDNPQNERIRFSYAFSTFNIGQEEKALQLMEEIVKANPNQSDALNFIAYSLADKNKNLDKAYNYIKRALSLKPDDGYYLDTYGWILFKDNKYIEALKTLKLALDKTKNDPVIIEHYGDVLVKTKNMKAAKKYYREAIQEEESKKNGDLKLINRINKKLENL